MDRTPCGRLEFEGPLDLDKTFGCGQAFRFSRRENGAWQGIACGKSLCFSVGPDAHTLAYAGCGEDFARSYLRLDLDPDGIGAAFLRPLRGRARAFMRGAALYGRGIRILRQEPFETLCTFILSQNNNIPRIRGLVEAICREYGEALPGGGHAFPTPQSLYDAGTDRLYALRTGFRAGYLHDAAAAVLDGRADLRTLETLPSPEAAARLQKIRGVGPKVAACTLLYGYGRLELFPVDVWIRRALDEYFGADFDPSVFGSYAGIAQQYIYYRKRG